MEENNFGYQGQGENGDVSSSSYTETQGEQTAAYHDAPVWHAESDSQNNGRTEGNTYGYVYGNPQDPPKKKRAGKKVALGIAIAAVCCLAIGGIYVGASYIVSAVTGDSGTGDKEIQKIETTEPITLTTSSTNIESGIVLTDVSAVVENVMPAIVAITSEEIIQDNSYWSWINGGSNQYIAQGAGSGIIIAQTDTELLIATNNHVVEDATSLSVQFIDEKSYDAVIKGTSAENDVAVIAIPLDSIDEDTLSAIKIAVIGDSDQLKVGQGVIAIGNALGYGQSVTVGVVSALDREVTTDGYTKRMMQIDAAINGGNSGGALINAVGEVVGINSAKYSSNGSSTTASVEGMGFAIPMNDVKDLLQELINKETKSKVEESDRGYLGIYGADIDESTAQFWGAPQGVMVSETISGYAAEKAGIQKNDIIVKLEGENVKSMDQLKEALSYYAAGDTVTITIAYQEKRQYVEKDIEVTLSKAPNN